MNTESIDRFLRSADRIFYNTWRLPQAFKDAVSDAREGSMVVIWPGDDKRIETFDTAAAFLKKHAGTIDTVALPGVGSSALGTAAFARTVANGLNRPTVGVVVGYGMADVMGEALEGCTLGMAERVRLCSDMLLRFAAPAYTAGGAASKMETASEAYNPSAESDTLLQLLTEPNHAINCLVGHSKGNKAIGNCLLEAYRRGHHGGKILDPEMCIIMFGAGTPLPDYFTNVHQYIGAMDLLGKANTPISMQTAPSKSTTPSWDIHWEPTCSHNLNQLMPFHMPVDDILERHREKEVKVVPPMPMDWVVRPQAALSRLTDMMTEMGLVPKTRPLSI
jgi:hypothetical protein